MNDIAEVVKGREIGGVDDDVVNSGRGEPLSLLQRRLVDVRTVWYWSLGLIGSLLVDAIEPLSGREKREEKKTEEEKGSKKEDEV